MQAYAFQFQPGAAIFRVEGIHQFPVRIESIPLIAVRIAAECGEVELRIVIENPLELLSQLRTVLYSLLPGKLADVEVLRGTCVVVDMAGLEKRIYATLRRLPIQWIECSRRVAG